MDQYVKDFESAPASDAPCDALLEQAGTVAAMTSATAVMTMFCL
jgi:hypothetical protein